MVDKYPERIKALPAQKGRVDTPGKYNLEITLSGQSVEHRVKRSRTDFVTVLAELFNHPTPWMGCFAAWFRT